MDKPAALISYIDPLYWLGVDTAIEQNARYKRDGGMTYDDYTARLGNDVSTITQSVTTAASNTALAIKLAFAGMLIFGGLVVIHEFKKAMK